MVKVSFERSELLQRNIDISGFDIKSSDHISNSFVHTAEHTHCVVFGDGLNCELER